MATCDPESRSQDHGRVMLSIRGLEGTSGPRVGRRASHDKKTFKAMFALASDGKAALACLEKRLPFWGLTFTPSHTACLTAFLEKEVYSR